MNHSKSKAPHLGGACALTLGVLICGWSGAAHAQVRSITNVQLVRTQNSADPSLYTMLVSCTALTAKEVCNVDFSENASFTPRSSVGNTPGARSVEAFDLSRTKTYYFRTNAILRSATPVSIGPYSPVVSYKFGQALPPGPPIDSAPVPATYLGTSTCENVKGTTLKMQGIMQPGTSFLSPNKKYSLRFQSDGNLVLQDTATKAALWEIGARVWETSKAVMHGDGSLKVLTLNGRNQWETPTKGSSATAVSLQDDGNLIIYADNSCQVLWAARSLPVAQAPDAGVPQAPASPYGTSLCSTVQGTTLRSGSQLSPGATMQSPNKKYELAYQTDGNLVVYGLTPSRSALWSSKTNGVAPLKLTMQADGNAVATKTGGATAWSTASAGNAGAVLSLQDDGNLVVYKKDSCSAVWARN